MSRKFHVIVLKMSRTFGAPNLLSVFREKVDFGLGFYLYIGRVLIGSHCHAGRQLLPFKYVPINS